ncbi:MAG: ATP-dependent DNA ligase [Verrucomicrobiota bacterium]|nr:ATP-dependent DNA ligase [Verrucomicrobiota bacterium]
MLDIRYHRGLELPAQGLWLDPWDAKPFAFVSHAHSDHVGQHWEIIASRGTAKLMQARVPGQRIEHILEFEQTTDLRGMQITLLAAGHIFGSAQFFLEDENDSLLYTGDFKLRPGLSAEATQWRTARTLIMETTYGLPKYRFPPTAQVIEQMVEFCREALDEGAVPVLLGYSLGKAQEILCALVQAGLTPMLHGAVFRMTRIYADLSADFPCGFEKYVAGETEGKVLICPPSANRSAMLNKIKNKRVAVLTGWAIDPGAHFRYQCDAAFPLSDHADYTDLIRYVELVKPERVLTLHGFAGAFARDLRERGIEAWALTEQNQLELGIRTVAATAGRRLLEAKTGGDAPPLQSEFGVFASLGEQIVATASKLKKIELLANYFRGLDEDQLPIAAVYLTGKAFAQTDSRALQAGWAVIKRALLAVSNAGEQRLREIALRHSDASKTAAELLDGTTRPESFTLTDSRDFFTALRAARGPIGKALVLEERLVRVSAIEAQYVVKILTGDLRIGLKEGLVEEAIASAFAANLHAVKEANMLRGDIGAVAVLARNGTLDQVALELFRPIKCMLASPEPSAEAIWERLAPTAANVWVEDKFDGIRAQLHRDGGRAEVFTRDLKCVTEQFDELARSARNLDADVIFDGEIVAFDSGRKLTFFDLQKRLGRKSAGDFFLGENIPVNFMIFDLLWLNGASLIKEPLHARRRLLEQLKLPAQFSLVSVASADSAAAIEREFIAARARSNEGLIIKDPASFYSPGRRGLAWLKLKKEFATLDVVVVGAELGHGKRNDVLSDYTFAVRDESSGLLVTIGKAYSGLTDEEIKNLTAHFIKNTTNQRGRFREVKPNVVLEIAFDSIQPSERHESGLALRFPRIKAIRTDKTASDIDTLAHAWSLVAQASCLPSS